MSTKLRGLFKSRRSKGAGKPEAQNARHPLDGPTTPPVTSETPCTNGQACRAGADLPARDPQPAIEYAVHQPQAISTSQRLWNDAYDSLANDNETVELVKAYVKTLTVVLEAEKAPPDDSAAGASDVTTELKDPTTRQMHMKKLLEEGQAKVFTASNMTKGVGDVAQFILSAKGLVDLAVQNVPQAALPWAGVCIGLQILLNPAKATRSNLAGITHVVSRMDWYCSLTEHLLNKDNIVVGDASFEAILQLLEKAVVALYKALLLYQMKSVCSYYRHQGLVFLRSLANLDDWDGDLKNVTDAEVTLQKDSDQYNSQHAKSSLGRLVEAAVTMETRLGDIRQTLRDFISLQKDMKMDEEDTKCLHDLLVMDPQDDMKTIEMKKDELLDDAYKWILDTKEYAAFTNWGNVESPLQPCRLLWVKGQAGTGKTMLLIGIIRQLSRQPAALSPNVSHFFCQGTDDKTYNNATVILRSLVWMLLIQQPQLISHLQSKYKYKGRSLFSDRNALVAISDVFKSMLKDPGLLPVYFIVDALDECGQGLTELIQLISTSLTLSDKVKWLVSSRPLVELKHPDTVELNAQRLERPVDVYINHKLSSLEGRDGYDANTLAEVSSEIHQRARNTFLWVALVFKELDSVEGWDAVDTIKKIPPGLSELYDHMMTRIEGENEQNRQRCKNVLVATFLACRPLSLAELAVLAGLLPKMTQTIVDKCGSFLTTKENTVYLIHQSANDYLKATYISRLQQEGVVQGHADMSRYSIDAMSKLKKNIYTLPYPGSQPEDIMIPSLDPLEGLRYSCIYWATHICQVWSQLDPQRSSTQHYDLVYQFLQEHLLHWIEALGWIGKTSDGILAILSLEAQIPTNKNPDLKAFIHDAKRFILHNRSVIEKAPLQIYCSALVFAPEKSIVRKQFEGHIPLWIQRSLKVQGNWSAALQTLEGHSNRVTSVAFSPDGKQIVSGSDDKTVQLWDAVTGVALQTLKGHLGWVTSVTFSPDSKQVVSGSDDKTVRLWDTVTGAALQTLKGHSDSVTSVAFSPDGKHIVSGSNDEIVQLWDALTGAALQTLKGYSGLISSIAFSPDSKQVVSGSDDKTVQLWDIGTGVALQTLKGHSNRVTSVAFSPNCKQVVSGSDKTVQLWDTKTGVILQTLKGHLGWVTSVTFSPDGKQVVSGSRDKTVRLWDAVTGAALQTLQGHSGWVTSVAFSPDSKQVVSCSYDMTVRLWDTVTGAAATGAAATGAAAIGPALQTLEGHSGSVTSIAFSPNGKQVVSAGSEDKTVQLWDTKTGVTLQTLKGHLGWVTSVTFSPDGKQVVSGSRDKTVRLWDAVTGAALQTLQGHSGWVISVALSPDGKQVVSGSDDRTVRLWDTVTGAALQTLENCSDSVRYSMAFSQDGMVKPSLFIANDWVVEGGTNILWLPPDYRATRKAVWNNVIVLGHSSGRISILGFKERSRLI